MSEIIKMPFLNLRLDSFVGGNIDIREGVENTKKFASAGQMCPDSLKKKIINLLDLLDLENKRFGDEPSNILDLNDKTQDFWKEFFEEVRNPKSDIGNYIMFLIFSVNIKMEKYGNKLKKLALHLNSAPKIMQDDSDEICSFHNKMLDKNILIILSVFMHNLIIPLSFIILISNNFTTKGILVNKLLKCGFTNKKSEKIIDLAQDLHKQIKGLINRKTSQDPKKSNSILAIEKNINYFSFFHKEFCKRKFYLDLKNNKNNIKSNFEYIKNYMQRVFLKLKYECEFCILNAQCFCEVIKTNYKSKNSLFCDRYFCEVKKDFVKTYNEIYGIEKTIVKNNILKDEDIVAIGISKDMYETYGYTPLSMLFMQNPEYIYDYYTLHNFLPYEDYIESAINSLDVKNKNLKEKTKIRSNNSLYKKILVNKLTQLENKTKEGKHHIDVNKFLIGLYIWDEINIFDNNKSISKISEGIIYSSLRSLIDKDFIFGDSVYKEHRDHCNECYILVKESIQNNNCKLLSTEEAIRRHSLEE